MKEKLRRIFEKHKLKKYFRFIKYKYNTSSVGRFKKFFSDQVSPTFIYMYSMYCGVMAIVLMPIYGVNDTFFSYFMKFTFYCICFAGIINVTNNLLQKDEYSILDKILFYMMNIMFTLMNMIFFVLKLGGSKSFVDTFTVSTCDYIFIVTSIISYPRILTYIASKSDKLRKMIYRNLIIGLIINGVLMLFSIKLIILLIIQAYFIIYIKKNINHVKLKENSLGIVVGTGNYGKIINSIKWLKDRIVKNKELSMHNSIKLKIPLNVIGILAAIFLSNRAYMEFYNLIVLPDSQNYILIHLEALTIMGFSIVIWGFQMYYNITKLISNWTSRIIDRNKFFTGILFLEMIYEIHHASTLIILTILWYASCLLFLIYVRKPRFKTI